MPRLTAVFAIGIAAMAALPACTEAVRAIRGSSSAFDGAWVGQLNVVTRTRSCTTTRGGIRVTIDGGVIDGTVRQGDSTPVFQGLILESGELASARIDARYDKDTAELSGRFEGDQAEGRWKNKECSGTWSLRQIR